MPLTGFWGRWRRRHWQHSKGSPPNLRETERQREVAERQAAEQMARIMSGGGVAEHHHSVVAGTQQDGPGRGGLRSAIGCP